MIRLLESGPEGEAFYDGLGSEGSAREWKDEAPEENGFSKMTLGDLLGVTEDYAEKLNKGRPQQSEGELMVR